MSLFHGNSPVGLAELGRVDIKGVNYRKIPTPDKSMFPKEEKRLKQRCERPVESIEAGREE